MRAITTTTRKTEQAATRRFAPLAAAGATLIAVAAITGCTQEGVTDPEELDAINTGRNAEIGPIDLRNLLIVTSAEGAPGRLIGVLLNSAEEDVEVVLDDGDESMTITVPADGEVELEEEAVIFETTEEPPGALAPLTVSVEAADEELLEIPVLDGSLERYRPFLPEG